MSVILDEASKAALALLLVARKRRMRNRRRRWWIHPVISNRSNRGKFFILQDTLKNHPDKFHDYYRMSIGSFDIILSAIREKLSKKNTVRESISAEEKLSITLRYLATGCSFRSLHFEYCIGRSTVAGIVRETCEIIWNTLHLDHMKPPTTEDWLNISENFSKSSNFPHCVGAIDGKHIRMIKPANSGSEFFNYKKFFSTVLMAVADSDYCFTFINVGSLGKESDCNILKETKIGKEIYDGSLNLPEPSPISNEQEYGDVPYVFVADEAFALGKHVLRPYPSSNLTQEKRIFNYRLSRARRFVECAFGLLANKWRIFHRPLDVDLEFCDVIVKTCCLLHNFVRRRDGYRFEDLLSCPLESIPCQGTRGSMIGIEVRDTFTRYFCSSEGSLPWQNNFA